MDLADWLSFSNRQDCKSCKQAFAPSRWDTPADTERKKNGPPCDTCKPGILPSNRLAYSIYYRVQDQWETTGFGQKVAIRVEAIKAIMPMLKVEESDQLECLDEVQIMARKIKELQDMETIRMQEEKESN